MAIIWGKKNVETTPNGCGSKQGNTNKTQHVDMFNLADIE